MPPSNGLPLLLNEKTSNGEIVAHFVNQTPRQRDLSFCFRRLGCVYLMNFGRVRDTQDSFCFGHNLRPKNIENNKTSQDKQR